MMPDLLHRIPAPRRRHTFTRADALGLGVAAFAGALALSLAMSVQRATGTLPYSEFLIPVALATWFGGYRIGALFLLVFEALIAFVIIPPAFTYYLTEGEIIAIISLAASSTLLMLLIEWRRLAVARTQELVEELERSNEAKTEFVQHVSHELRTPMTIIEGNAAMLARRWQALDDDQRGECLEDIVDATKRLESITTNLLSLARLGAGYEVEREPVVIAHVVASVVERHRGRHPERTYQLVADGERDPVTCAPVYLTQVVENLLTNAEKYSPVEAEITVRVERSGAAVRVSVLDRGRGIRPEEAAALFEPFYRGADRGSAPGLGIGLAVCKRFAESEGGAMSAAARDGGGAEFAITLPVSEAEDELQEAPRATAPDPERASAVQRVR